MEYFIIPFLFGLATGFVGWRKGSSFMIWCAVGFLLPAIGLTAALLSQSQLRDPRRECPTCHKTLPISAQVCMRCGEDLEYPEEFVVVGSGNAPGN